MKFKRHVYITSPAQFALHPDDGSFSLYAREHDVPGWFKVGEIEIDVDLDIVALKRFAVKDLDSTITEIQKEADGRKVLYENWKSQLLCLEYDGGEVC